MTADDSECADEIVEVGREAIQGPEPGEPYFSDPRIPRKPRPIWPFLIFAGAIFRPAAKRLSVFCCRPFSLFSDQKIAEANLPANVAGRHRPASATRWAVLTSWPSSWSISSPSSRSSSWLPLAGSSVCGVCWSVRRIFPDAMDGKMLCVENSTSESRDRATHRAARLD